MDDVHLLITLASVVGALAFFGAGFFLRRAPVVASPVAPAAISVEPKSVPPHAPEPRPDSPTPESTHVVDRVPPGTPLPQVLRRLVENNGAAGALMCTHDGLIIDSTDGVADHELGALIGLIGQLGRNAAADGLLGTTRTLEVQAEMWGTVRCRFSGDPHEPRILATVGPHVTAVPHVEEAALAAVDDYVAA